MWITTYERYRNVTRLDKQPQKSQVDSMLLHMGAQVNKLLDTLNAVDDDWNSYTKMKSLFENHYIKKVNIIYERSKFNTRAQKEGETAQEFIAAIIQLSKTCNYGIMTEKLLRNRLVVGIPDYSLSEKLQRENEQVNGIGEIINKVQGGGSKPWTMKLNLNEEKILFKIDTGADESILSLNCYRKMKNPPKIKKTSLKLCGPTGIPLSVEGVVKTCVNWKNEQHKLKFYVIDNKENLSGRPAICAMKLIQCIEQIERCDITDR
ncbi:hypothetical protein QE152_g4603 [Popillia japonica]|uniref:Peptidase A2 domain-containing protein n=1 Tax=Popillia japonica TaxID=7064 RepID=A0AAW1N000_POPJA